MTDDDAARHETDARLPFHDNYPYTLIVDDGYAELVYVYPEGEWEEREWKTHRHLSIEADEPIGSLAQYVDPEGRGWRDSISVLWDFIEQVVAHYERDVDARAELPLHVETNRSPDDRDRTSEAEQCEVYIRDNEGGEYLMWHSDELYGMQDGESVVNDELVQTVLVAVADAYEEPEAFIEQWGHRRVQVE